MCNSCRGLEVEITCLDLKEDLVCLPIWQASQSLSFSNLKLGRPLTKQFLEIFEIKCMLACPSLLCNNQELSCKTERHLSIIGHPNQEYTHFHPYFQQTKLFYH